MYIVFEGNITLMSHNRKWSQWGLEPGSLSLIRTCCEAALMASTVDIQVLWVHISDGEGCFTLITGHRLFSKISLYSEEYEAIPVQASFLLTCSYPVLKLSCLFLLAIYFQARVLWREIKSLIACYGISLLRKKKLTFLVFQSGTFWWEVSFLTSASLIHSTIPYTRLCLEGGGRAEVWEESS